MTDYSYMISNNKIEAIINKIQQAVRPAKFTQEFLKNLGFTSTNDRAFIPLLKKLEFLNEDGTPTPLYDQLKDNTITKVILANQIKEYYSELYTINTDIHNASDEEIKCAISRVTGKDEVGVNRIFNTFKALCKVADFNITEQQNDSNIEQNEKVTIKESTPVEKTKNPQFHYNIQIHLPATNDISVYNAIFKSLKDNLLM